MTWMYELVNGSDKLIIYDHNDEKIVEKKNDGSGFHLPEDITNTMREEAEKAREKDNMNRWRDIHIRLADNDFILKP